MSIESLRSEIDFVLDNCNDDWNVAQAALNDFMRGLHEVYTKSGRDQTDLLSQVQTVFGSTVAHHLAEVLQAKTLVFKSYPTLESCPLNERATKACIERGITVADGKHFFAHFLKALDEERPDKDGNLESPVFMIYMTLGDEAAYHLGGLYAGDEFQIAIVELQYLDFKVSRFSTLVERWEMELKWHKEDQE